MAYLQTSWWAIKQFGGDKVRRNSSNTRDTVSDDTFLEIYRLVGNGVRLFRRPRLFRVLYVQCHTTYPSLSSFLHLANTDRGLHRRSEPSTSTCVGGSDWHRYLYFGVMTLSLRCCHILAFSLFLHFLGSRCKWSRFEMTAGPVGRHFRLQAPPSP